MKSAVRTMLFAAALPLATGAVAAPVCPVKPHRAVHVHKAVLHKTAGGVGVVVDQARLVAFTSEIPGSPIFPWWTRSMRSCWARPLA